MKILYANGCSMAEGCELGNAQFGVTDPANCMTSRFDKNITKEHSEHIIKNCWPYLLKDLLGIPQILNTAQGGSCNARIVRDTMVQVSTLLKTYKPEEIFVAIGWSRLSRLELYEKDYYYQVSAESTRFIRNPEFKNFVLIHDMLANSEAKYVLGKHFAEIVALRNFLENKGIKYFFSYGTIEHVPSMLSSQELYKATYLEEVNALFGAPVLDAPWIFYDQNPNTIHKESTIKDYLFNLYSTCFQHFQIVNNYARGLGNHPLEEAHQAWAKFLYAKIREKGIL